MATDDITRFVWGNDKVDIEISYGPDRPCAIERIAPHGSTYAARETFSHPQSIVQITADGFMQENFGSRYSETLIGNDMRYVSHKVVAGQGEQTLLIDLTSATYGLAATVSLTLPDGVGAVRAHVQVTNKADEPITLTSVSSLSAYVCLGANDANTWDVMSGRSDWLAEGRWRREPARDYELVRLLNVDSSSVRGDVSPTVTPYGATMTRCSTSSRSTCNVLPAGALIDNPSGEAIFWQIEAMGPWLWQIGERIDGFYLVLSGPTDIEHHWCAPLAKGESFTTVDATVAVSAKEFDGAADEMTKYRRHIVRKHEDHKNMPVIFNDYMNTLMGDPTTENELPLIEAAAKAGAEYYCVDCGWYDNGGDWWPSVGEWRESTVRFPKGLTEVFDHIKACGMKPGIWLEPEVVGIKSPLAQTLPADAFMQRDGKRIQTHLRYLLDLRHPAARKHLDETVDRLVNEYGVRFFKLDYNVNTGAGTNTNAPSRGAGQLGASRAYVEWLSGVLDRHPDLTIETCSSGSMRSDPALLAQSQLQSTSDQQDYREYANIVVSAPALMLPEQCGNWAYPNADMSLAETRLCMLNGIVGRLYLSGYLTEMGEEQFTEIQHALEVHKSIRQDIAKALPFWPLGMPQWNDAVVALGLEVPESGVSYLAFWIKNGLAKEQAFKLKGNYPAFTSAEAIYGSDITPAWDAASGTLTLVPGASMSGENPSCVLLKLS